MKQLYTTHCDNCGEEAHSVMLDLTGKNEIPIEFIEGMEFECECGSITYVSVEKYTD